MENADSKPVDKTFRNSWLGHASFLLRRYSLRRILFMMFALNFTVMITVTCFYLWSNTDNLQDVNKPNAPRIVFKPTEPADAASQENVFIPKQDFVIWNSTTLPPPPLTNLSATYWAVPNMTVPSRSPVLRAAEEAMGQVDKRNLDSTLLLNIPPIIHQQWRDTNIPAYLTQNLAIFTRMHPTYTHLLWTDADLDNFVEKYHASIYMLYISLPKPILRADLARYLLLYTFGGTYSDLDTYPIRPIDTWAATHDRNTVRLIVGIEADTQQPDYHDWFTRYIQFTQWTMSAMPRHPVMSRVVGMATQMLYPDMESGVTDIDVLERTGPGPWTDAVFVNLAQYGTKPDDLRGLNTSILVGDIVVLPITGFSPGVGHMGSKPISDPEACVFHQFFGSWKKPGNP